MKLYWYDVCNDYSLELRDEAPPESELDEMDIQVGEFGTYYAFDFDNEGPIYLQSDEGDLAGEEADCE